MRFLIIFLIFMNYFCNAHVYCNTLSFLKKNFLSIIALYAPISFSALFFIMHHRIMLSRQNNMRSPEEQEQEDQYKQYISWYKGQIDALLIPERQEFLKNLQDFLVFVDTQEDLWKKKSEYASRNERIENEKMEKNIEENEDNIKKLSIVFQEDDLLLLYFWAITEKKISINVIEKLSAFFDICSPRNYPYVWSRNLLELFVNCGSTYQNMFLKFSPRSLNFGEYYSSNERNFNITYDILKYIKKKTEIAKNNQKLVEFEHLQKFLANLIVTHKNSPWSGELEWLIKQIICVPLWRIGEATKEESYQLCQEFIDIINWFSDFLDSNKEVKNYFFLYYTREGYKNKMKFLDIPFNQIIYKRILKKILYNIEPRNDPHCKPGAWADCIMKCDQNIENFKPIFEKLDTKIHNKFFIVLITTELKKYHWVWAPERYKQFYDLLYNVSQYVNFKKEDNWKITIVENNYIKIRSDYFDSLKKGSMVEHDKKLFKSRSPREDFLSGAQKGFINKKWTELLTVVSENNCEIPECLPKVVYD